MNKSFSPVLFICVLSVSAQSIDKVKLDQYLESLVVNEKAMFSLSVIKNGEPIYQKLIDFADVEHQQKANKDKQYRIGSVSKVFTSTMIFS
jgi:D-alanyl-D-alanine carboxypeptidase